MLQVRALIYANFKENKQIRHCAMLTEPGKSGLKETVANLISHYDLPGFGTDSNFPALQTVKNNNKIKESNIMKKFIFFTL